MDAMKKALFLLLILSLLLLPIMGQAQFIVTPAPCDEGESTCSNDGMQLLTCVNNAFSVVKDCPFGCQIALEGKNAGCRKQPFEEICNNAIDDDRDTFVDGDDEDCKSKKQYDSQNNNYNGMQYFLFTIIIILLLFIIYMYKKNKKTH